MTVKYEARLAEPLPVAAVIEPGVYHEVKVIVKTKDEWKCIDQGIQPRRTLRVESA